MVWVGGSISSGAEYSNANWHSYTAALSATEIKALYESNLNTNELSDLKKEILDNVTIVGDEIIFNKAIFSPSIRTSPGETLKVGNVNIVSASHGLGIKNTINEKHALLNFQIYNELGVEDPRIFKSSNELTRVLFSDSSSIQPSLPYSFDTLAAQPNHELIKTVKVIPSEAGELKVIMRGKGTGLEALSISKTIELADVGSVVELEFGNSAIFEIGDINTFEINGVRLLGGNFELNGEVFWVPYVEAVEHYIEYERGATKEYVDSQFDYDRINAVLSTSHNVPTTNDGTIPFDSTTYSKGIVNSNGEFTVSKGGLYTGNVYMFLNELGIPTLHLWVEIKKNGGSWSVAENSLVKKTLKNDEGESWPLNSNLELDAGDMVRIRVRALGGASATMTASSFVTELGVVEQPAAQISFYRAGNKL